VNMENAKPQKDEPSRLRWVESAGQIVPAALFLPVHKP
jgi:hypothetical protein